MKRKLGILYFLSFFCSNLFAQTGCLLPDNTLHTTSNGYLLLNPNPLYKASDYESLPESYCVWMPGGTMGSCSVCPNDNYIINLAGLKICNTGILTGTIGTYTLQCPFDDFTFILLVAVSFLGMYFVKDNLSKTNT